MTPHRVFQDDQHQTWTAWDVIPSWGERRASERRRGRSGPPSGLLERRRGERRVTRGIRIALSPHLARGWLAFESGTLRRRLAPIPQGWDQLPDDELRRLLDSAEGLAEKKRRLIE